MADPGEELQQKSKQLALAIRAYEARRRRHKDMSMPIGFDTVGKLREVLVGEDLAPSSQVESGLRLKIRELNRNRYARKIRQQRKNAVSLATNF
jgi:hypothetical protein